MNRNGVTARFFHAILLILACLVLSGCLSWQARQVVEPDHEVIEFKGDLDALVADLESEGLVETRHTHVGEPRIAFRYLIFRPARYDFQYTNRSDSEGASFSASIGEGETIDCDSINTLIFLHGYLVRSEHAYFWMPPFTENCWQVISPDLRAHGGSGGRYASYGALETRDLLDWLQQLQHTGDLKGRVAVLGLSFGGTLALRLNIRGLDFADTIAIAPFESGRAAVQRYAARMHWPLRPSSNRLDRIHERAASLAQFRWQDTEIKGKVTSDALVIASEGDRINPADQACLLAGEIGASCRVLEAPFPHPALMLPVAPLIKLVTETLGVDYSDRRNLDEASDPDSEPLAQSVPPLQPPVVELR